MKRVFGVTLLLWAVATISLALLYSTRQVATSTEEYINRWDFKLASFALVIFPACIIVLFVVLFVEWKWLNRKVRNDRS
jgi:uncharacterized BrkB/YihY/UPF0761 family membrane protein